MPTDPIRSEADYETALAEFERLWGAESGTPDGDRLDMLATAIDAYEAQQFPMKPPDPSDARLFRMSAGAFDAFMAALDAPAKPVPKLVELLRRRAPWEPSQ